MTHNASRDTLAELIYDATGTLGQTSSENLADAILEKFDVTEKPEPIGTVRQGRCGTLYLKTSPVRWLGLYLGGETQELEDHRGPWGDTEVFRP